MDISVILPVMNEAENLRILIPRLIALLDRERITHEIIVIDGPSTDGTREVAEQCGARVVGERRRGYAGALMTGIEEARGDYVLTLDADQSHDPDFVFKMWRARKRADIVVASRYVLGGVAYSDFIRRSTSWFLNQALRRLLSIPVLDMSSGYRLYRREVFRELEITSSNFEVGRYFVRRCRCGKSATRSRLPTTTSAPSTARFHRSAIGNAAAIASRCCGRAVRIGCSTRDAARV
jgi:glycosyltransferase involved in cell wall biosynthesis